MLPENNLLQFCIWENAGICVISATFQPVKRLVGRTLRIANFSDTAPALREHFYTVWMHMGWMWFNALSVEASTAAWQHGAPWLDRVNGYLAENRRWFIQQIDEHLPVGSGCSFPRNLSTVDRLQSA